MKTTIIAAVILLFAGAAQAQETKTATVAKYETRSYSQSAHIIRDRVVYTLDVDQRRYEITRDRDKPEFQPGEVLQVRLDNRKCYVVKNGKQTKFEVIGEQ